YSNDGITHTKPLPERNGGNKVIPKSWMHRPGYSIFSSIGMEQVLSQKEYYSNNQSITNLITHSSEDITNYNDNLINNTNSNSINNNNNNHNNHINHNHSNSNNMNNNNSNI